MLFLLLLMMLLVGHQLHFWGIPSGQTSPPLFTSYKEELLSNNSGKVKNNGQTCERLHKMSVDT